MTTGRLRYPPDKIVCQVRLAERCRGCRPYGPNPSPSPRWALLSVHSADLHRPASISKSPEVGLWLACGELPRRGTILDMSLTPIVSSGGNQPAPGSKQAPCLQVVDFQSQE